MTSAIVSVSYNPPQSLSLSHAQQGGLLSHCSPTEGKVQAAVWLYSWSCSLSSCSLSLPPSPCHVSTSFSIPARLSLNQASYRCDFLVYCNISKGKTTFLLSNFLILTYSKLQLMLINFHEAFHFFSMASSMLIHVGQTGHIASPSLNVNSHWC